MNRHVKYNFKRKYKRFLDRIKIRAWISQIKNRPCADCGRLYPSVCMDFDHRPGEEKKFMIGKNANGMAIKTLQEEINKCDVVCANCHRIRTRDRRT